MRQALKKCFINLMTAIATIAALFGAAMCADLMCLPSYTVKLAGLTGLAAVVFLIILFIKGRAYVVRNL